MNRLSLCGRLPSRLLRPSSTGHLFLSKALKNTVSSPLSVPLTRNSSDKVWKSSIPSPAPVDKSIYAYVTDAIAKHSKAKPKATALLSALNRKKRLTYKQLGKQIKGMEAFLHKRGFQKGDVAAALMPNCIECPVMLMAIVGRGGVFSGITPMATECKENSETDYGSLVEIEERLKENGAKIVFASDELLEKVQAVAKKLPHINTIVVVRMTKGPLPTGVFDWKKAVLTEGEIPHVPVSMDDVALLPFSSGSMGTPKGVQLTHTNFVTCARGIVKNITDYEEPYLKKLFKKEKKDRGDGSVLVYLAFHHIYGLMTAMTSIVCGNPIAKVNLVPPVLQFLVKNPLTICFDLSHVRLAVSGASSMRENICQAFEKKFPNTKLIQSYGLTECGGSSHLSSDFEEDRSWSHCGSLIAGMEARIVDTETGKEMESGERGELQLRGPGVMKGYQGREEETAATVDEDGWLKTGDIAYVDEKERLHIVGRQKELIKVKGLQVSPAELEAVLLNSPRVKDAAVVGVPHVRYGEGPKAFVLKEDPWLDEEAVTKIIEEYKWLTGGVEFVEEIPRLPTGKIVRRMLK